MRKFFWAETWGTDEDYDCFLTENEHCWNDQVYSLLLKETVKIPEKIQKRKKKILFWEILHGPFSLTSRHLISSPFFKWDFFKEKDPMAESYKKNQLDSELDYECNFFHLDYHMLFEIS